MIRDQDLLVDADSAAMRLDVFIVRRFPDTRFVVLSTQLDAQLLLEVQHILSPIHNQTWPSGLRENN